jgi:hypothetical protein
MRVVEVGPAIEEQPDPVALAALDEVLGRGGPIEVADHRHHQLAGEALAAGRRLAAGPSSPSMIPVVQARTASPRADEWASSFRSLLSFGGRPGAGRV